MPCRFFKKGHTGLKPSAGARYRRKNYENTQKKNFLDQNVNKPRLASSEPTEVTLADIAEVILADIPEADIKEAELELIKEDKLLKIKEYIFG